jgi:broad specificity phosphatase PhoE
MTHLYLIRHGENVANITKEFSHRKVDYSLTPKGCLQAEQTAAALRDRGISAVYASPLHRATETAAYLADAVGCDVVVMEQFREVNVGDLEGQPPTAESWKEHNDILRAWRHGQFDLHFPNGENFYDLWQRVSDGYRTVVTENPAASVAIVAHGGVFTMCIKALCPDVDLAEILRQESHNCSITEVVVELQGDTLRGELIRWAAFDHLQGEAAEIISGVPSHDFFAKAAAPGA